MKIEKILVAVDLEKNSDIVIGAGLRLAAKLGARVTLVHVSEAMPYFVPQHLKLQPSIEDIIARYREKAEQQIRELAGDQDGSLDVRTVVTEGRPLDYILDSIADGAQDLLVMGTHGRRGVEHLLLGSNADRVVRQSPVPVLCVNTREPAYQNLNLERILLATDFSDNARDAEPYAVELARAYGAEILVAHIVEERFHPYIPYHVSGIDVAAAYDSHLKAVRARYEELTRETTERIAAQGVTCRSRLVEDAPSVADGLLTAVRESEVQLAVLGTHGRTGIDRALLGSVAEKFVRMSPAAVLTVRSPSKED